MSRAVSRFFSKTHPGRELTVHSVLIILRLISFFISLAGAEWLADKVLRASLIGPIVIGVIYGVPLCNVLLGEWQETFLTLGYLGLLLIIFEGALIPFPE